MPSFGCTRERGATAARLKRYGDRPSRPTCSRGLGRKSVAEVTTSDVLAVLTHDGFWSTKRETARKIRQRISTIMDWAAAQGHRTDNPCHALKAALPKAGHKTQHQRALPYDRVSDAVSRVQASAGLSHDQARFRTARAHGRRAAARYGARGGRNSTLTRRCGQFRASERRQAGRIGYRSRRGRSTCCARRRRTKTAPGWYSRALAD